MTFKNSFHKLWEGVKGVAVSILIFAFIVGMIFFVLASWTRDLLLLLCIVLRFGPHLLLLAGIVSLAIAIGSLWSSYQDHRARRKLPPPPTHERASSKNSTPPCFP